MLQTKKIVKKDVMDADRVEAEKISNQTIHGFCSSFHIICGYAQIN